MGLYWALVDYSDVQGEHKAGDQVEIADQTEEELANVEALVQYGVISREQPQGENQE